MEKIPEIKDKSYQESMDHCDHWIKMYTKLGPLHMAKLMMKTPSYRAYIQKWPFDFRLMPVDYDDIDILSREPSVEDTVSSRMEIDELESRLGPRTLEVWKALKSGSDNSQIESDQNFSTNNAVRWHKHKIKKTLEDIQDKRYNDYICSDCGSVFRDLSGLDCPKCGSRNIYKVTVENRPF